MYAQQPKENTSGLDDATLASIATTAGASDAVASCIRRDVHEVRHRDDEKTPVQPGQSGVATPTIAVNGTVLSNQNDLTGEPQKDIVARLDG